MPDIVTSKLLGGGKTFADLNIGNRFTINEDVYEKSGEDEGICIDTGEIQKFFKFAIIDGGENA